MFFKKGKGIHVYTHRRRLSILNTVKGGCLGATGLGATELGKMFTFLIALSKQVTMFMCLFPNLKVVNEKHSKDFNF